MEVESVFDMKSYDIDNILNKINFYLLHIPQDYYLALSNMLQNSKKLKYWIWSAF